MTRGAELFPQPRLIGNWRADDWSRWTEPPDLTKDDYLEAAAITAELVAVAALRRSAGDDAYPGVERLPAERRTSDADLLHPLAG